MKNPIKRQHTVRNTIFKKAKCLGDQYEQRVSNEEIEKQW